MRAYEFIVEQQLLFELSDKKRRELKNKFKSEDSSIDDDEIDFYLSEWEHFVNSVPRDKKDITQLSFETVKSILDELILRQELKGKRKGRFINDEETLIRNTLLYRKDGLEIHKADTPEKAEYLTTSYKGNYSWCIQSSKMFWYYRVQNETIFYFVFDSSKPKDDVWHAIVIYDPGEHHKSETEYMVSLATNPGDKRYTWNEIVTNQPKLNGLTHLFAKIPLAGKEKELYNKYNESNNNDVDYKNLSFVDKFNFITYSQTPLTPEMQDDTDLLLLGHYAKNNYTHITANTFWRLSNSDKTNILKKVCYGNSVLSAVNFFRRIKRPAHQFITPKLKDPIEHFHKHLMTHMTAFFTYMKEVLTAPLDETDIPSHIIDMMLEKIVDDHSFVYDYANTAGGPWHNMFFDKKWIDRAHKALCDNSLDGIRSAMAYEGLLDEPWYAVTGIDSKIVDTIIKNIVSNNETAVWYATWELRSPYHLSELDQKYIDIAHKTITTFETDDDIMLFDDYMCLVSGSNSGYTKIAEIIRTAPKIIQDAWLEYIISPRVSLNPQKLLKESYKISSPWHRLNIKHELIDKFHLTILANQEVFSEYTWMHLKKPWYAEDLSNLSADIAAKTINTLLNMLMLGRDSEEGSTLNVFWSEYRELCEQYGQIPAQFKKCFAET